MFFRRKDCECECVSVRVCVCCVRQKLVPSVDFTLILQGLNKMTISVLHCFLEPLSMMLLHLEGSIHEIATCMKIDIR